MSSGVLENLRTPAACLLSRPPRQPSKKSYLCRIWLNAEFEKIKKKFFIVNKSAFIWLYNWISVPISSKLRSLLIIPRRIINQVYHSARIGGFGKLTPKSFLE
jgi:hypothetical protein